MPLPGCAAGTHTCHCAACNHPPCCTLGTPLPCPAAGEPVPDSLENDGAPDFLDVGLVYLHNMASGGYGGGDGATGYILK